VESWLLRHMPRLLTTSLFLLRSLAFPRCFPTSYPHTYYIYIYIYVCMYVCMSVARQAKRSTDHPFLNPNRLPSVACPTRPSSYSISICRVRLPIRSYVCIYIYIYNLNGYVDDEVIASKYKIGRCLWKTGQGLGAVPYR
jgi:hypothetical protein